MFRFYYEEYNIPPSFKSKRVDNSELRVLVRSQSNSVIRPQLKFAEQAS